jgi:Mrp family chromosome partitioning ATPase
MTKVFEALERAESEKPDQAPLIPSPDRREVAPPVSDGSIEETLIGLYQSIRNALGDSETHVVEFVGTTESAGASALLCKFVQVVAYRLGRRVLYVGVNARPGREMLVSPSQTDGLGEAIRLGRSLDDACHKLDGAELYATRLSAAGSEETAALIDAPKFQEALEKLKERFELIAFDPPPVAIAPDAFALASVSSGTVLVVESERTRWQVADAARTRLLAQGGRLLGVILNKRKHHIPGFIYNRL